MIVAFDWIIIALGAYFFCLATINALWMGKETRRAELTDGPLVSVLVPARNEEEHIVPCIESLKHIKIMKYSCWTTIRPTKPANC